MNASLFRRNTSRRVFFGQSVLLAGAALTRGRLCALETNESSRPLPHWRAAIIGHTGQGDYGHGHDLIFKGWPNIEVVAVADPDPAGRAAAAQRIGAARQYSDYREMLEKEKPNLVSIAPRWTDQHYPTALAALRAGAHVYMEKPFTQTLAEADALLGLAQAKALKIAVAHQMRLAPAVLELKSLIDRGALGRLLEIRAHGKQDQRAGGEDMLVLGTHLFDLIRFFAGDARECTASIWQQGRAIRIEDKRAATEKIGPVAGDDVQARFRCANGVSATFTSRREGATADGPWGLEFIGTLSNARLMANISPVAWLLPHPDWKQWPAGPPMPKRVTIPGLPEGKEESTAEANRRVVADWLDAIQKPERDPVCSGVAAMKALEMVMAVYQSALASRTVSLPLEQREHPLGKLV